MNILLNHKRMFIMKRKNFLWAAAALLIAACSSDDGGGSVVSSLPIKFSADIISTRVSNGAWEENDRIGITMSGEGITAVENVPYVLRTLNGQFEAEGTPLMFPDPARDVTFHAYYPYSPETTGQMFIFDVDGKTDVLWSERPVAAAEQTSNTVELNSSHVLTQVSLNTVGFPDDVTVVMTGADYSRAVLNIADGTVAGVGTPEIVSIPFTRTGEARFSAIILPVEGVDKTLVIQSASTGETWQYELTSVTYDESLQYNYSINADSDVIIQDNITQWVSGEPVDLWKPAEPGQPGTGQGTVEGEIANLLAGKTYTLDTDYYYDETDANGWGWSEGSFGAGNYANEDGSGKWYWDETLYNQCLATEITFYASSGTLLADVKDNGVEKKGITVTVDDAARTLTFSQAPFEFHWVFTNNTLVNGQQQRWYLLAEDTNPDGGDFLIADDVPQGTVDDLFANGNMHWGYLRAEATDAWDGATGYRVANFVEK